MCNLYGTVAAFVGFADILSLTAIAIERCVVISRGVHSNSAGKRTFAYTCVVFIVVMSTIWAFLPIFGLGKYTYDAANIYCTFDFFTQSTSNVIYNIASQFMFLYVPLVIMVVCYGRIYYVVKCHEHELFSNDNNSMQENALAFVRSLSHDRYVKTEIRVARAAFITICAFLLSWAPYAIIATICITGHGEGVTRLVTTIPEIMAKISTIFNPLIYALLHKQFQNKMWVLYRSLFKKSPRKQSPNTVALRRMVGVNAGNDDARSYSSTECSRRAARRLSRTRSASI